MLGELYKKLEKKEQELLSIFDTLEYYKKHGIDISLYIVGKVVNVETEIEEIKRKIIAIQKGE